MKRSPLFAFAALAFTQTLPRSITALPSPQLSTRIIGGELAREGEFPFIVSFRSVDGNHVCGGSLLNADTVLTAAHCVSRPTDNFVVAGSLSRISGGESRNISSIAVHPGWDEAGATDIAILRLTAPLEESPDIGYIDLPPPNSDPVAGSLVNLAGWGYTDQEAELPPPEYLMRVTAPIIDRAICNELNPVSEERVCVGVEEGGKGACFGDSGGPMVDADGLIVGVFSSGGPVCATAERPSVYQRVSTVLDWIKANS